MLACAVLFCAMGSTVRILVAEHGASVFWVGWCRFVIGALAMLIPGVLGVWSLQVVNRRVLVCRGLFGATGQFLLFAVIAYVGLGRGTVLAYLMGVVGAVSGIFILKEHPRPIVFAAVGLATVGVLLSCRAGVPVGVEWLAIGAALASGVTLSFVRLMRRTDSTQTIFLSQGVFGSVMLLPFIFSSPVPSTIDVWLLVALMSAFDIGGQLCMTEGLGLLPVARGSALMMLTPVLSLLAGVLFFSESLLPLQWFGCVIVIGASTISVASRSMTITSQPSQNAEPDRLARAGESGR